MKNTGKIALSCINVTDVMTSCQGGEWVLYDKSLTCCLAPCETKEIMIDFIVPQECCGDFMLTNSVTATAWAEDVFVSWSDTEMRHGRGRLRHRDNQDPAEGVVLVR